MSLWKRLFGKKDSRTSTPGSGETAATPPTTARVVETSPSVSVDKALPPAPAVEQPETPLLTGSGTPSAAANRRIRVFISSTFRDMIEERDDLMTHTWPQLRRLCQERHAELVEVDLRWGIAESQSTRKETLKLCLDEIRSCRPYFIGLLGERYGWIPGDDAFSADLKDEQPWLSGVSGKSITEMEILHGVLNNPEMAGRAYFYFRDPAYAEGRGPDFLSETEADAEGQAALKALIRTVCIAKRIPLRENYPDPSRLAAMVLADLSAAIEAQFPEENIPDPLTREAQDHEAFAEIRRRTYISRADYFEALDAFVVGRAPSRGAVEGSKPDTPGQGTGPTTADNPGALVLLGESGSGKSALLANWLALWRKSHPRDFIFQHYIGSTTDSAEHWGLMARLIAEIKRWSDDSEELPRTHDDLLKTFPVWLAKARLKAERDGVRCLIVMDALNQLEDRDHARLLGWLPAHPFTGPLRLIVSTLPGDTLKPTKQRHWQALRVQPLTPDERRRMIADYLARFGKKLDAPRLERLTAAPAAANPLYLKILLDELRVTGTHDRLDERLDVYLAAPDIPALLNNVLDRYQHDYEHDRPGLVGEALGLIWAARRGLTETELLRLLTPQSEIRNRESRIASLPQLPPAIWNPLRAALEEGLVDRGGVLNFAHDFLRAAVETAFVPDRNRLKGFRLQLADDFEKQPVTARSCDELPWLLWQTNRRKRLRSCLLEIERFQLIHERDQEELMRYWVWLKEDRTMGRAYVTSFESWSAAPGRENAHLASGANQLAYFLNAAALHGEAESLMRLALAVWEKSLGENHPNVAVTLHNLAQLLQATNRLAEAEPLMRRGLAIDEQSFGPDHPNVAEHLNNLAHLLQATNRLAEAEPLLRRSLAIHEQSFGRDHPKVATRCNNLAILLGDTNRFAEAEPLLRRALAISEKSLGENHPNVASNLQNLARFLQATNRLAETEPLLRRALAIDEKSFGPNHPSVAIGLNNLAELLKETNRLAEAEPFMRRALAIDEGNRGPDHPETAIRLSNLAILLQATNRLAEAEPLLRRALAINEKSFGPDHPSVAISLNNLANLLKDTNRLAEAEPSMRRALAIDEQSLGPDHPDVALRLNNLAGLMIATNRTKEAIPLIERGLRINEASLGPDHPSTALSLLWLADAYQSTNRLAEAEPLMRRGLAIDERSFGPDHPNVALDLSNLTHLLQGANRLAEAEPLMRRQLEILLKFTCATGHQHPHLLDAVNTYAGLLHQMGMSQEQVREKVEDLLAVYGLSLGGG
jgi:nephrocystin-3